MHGRVSMSGRCSRGVLVPGGDGTIVMAGYSFRAFLLIMWEWSDCGLGTHGPWLLPV